MSIAIPSINAKLKFEVNDTAINLNKANEDFTTIYSYQGYGNLISACFKLSSENVIFKIVIDANEVCNLDIEMFNEVVRFSNQDSPLPIVFDIDQKLLYIKFDQALHYSRNIEFFLKGNSNNKVERLEGYVFTITKDNL